jgi:type IV pilus assembly protein PilY1
MTTQEYDNLALRVSAKSGWYINFEQNGEKSSSTAMVINNTAYFTSFSPPQLGVHSTSCNIPSGRSWLYAVDLSLGLNKYNWLSENNEQSLNRDDRIKYINDQFLDKPTLIVTEHDHDNNPDTDTEQISGIITGNEVILGDFSPQTFRTYLTVDE